MYYQPEYNMLLKINRKHKISRLLHQFTNVLHVFRQIPDTGFSVCVVLNETERYTEFAEPSQYPNHVLFHRTDLTEGDPAKCSEHGRIIFPSKSPVPLTSQSIHRPYAKSMDELSSN